MSTHHIAVVGMAGRFPGAHDLGEYWGNLRNGVECVEFPGDAELLARGVPADLVVNRDYVKAFAAAPGIRDFDADLFRYTPRDAARTDPQIRLFLECAHAALEHAGCRPAESTPNIAVYGSAGHNRYLDLHLGQDGQYGPSGGFTQTFLNYTDYVASTTAYKLGLRGAAVSVSTACSSSLVAVHLASQALRNGECDVALAGGAEVEMPFGHGYLWAEGGPFSSDGHVRPFDVKADGVIFSSGAGVVVLKRLADALADGDTIHAVLRGSSVNNDAAAKVSFSAPSIQGQALMLAEAMAMSELSARDISFVECHATGTRLGDPVEVAALSRAFRSQGGGSLPAQSVAISSVKANVGHLGHASGVASLIKTVLALTHAELPPTVNFAEPNPRLELDHTPFYVTDRLQPWSAAPGCGRVAGVSSFGVGGTNAHVVLEEPPRRAAAAPRARPRIVVWSAVTEPARHAYAERLAAYFGEATAGTFAAAVNTLQRGRQEHPLRSAVVADSTAEAAGAIGTGTAVIHGDGSVRDIFLAFPGQGSLRAGGASGLYEAEPQFAATMDDVLSMFASHGIEARDEWPRPADDASSPSASATQALLFAIDYSMAQYVLANGIRPAALIGHSLGELAAATVAGVWSLPEAVALVSARTKAMLAAPPGCMLAVAMPAARLAGLIDDSVTLAVINGPAQCILSGGRDEILAMQARLISGGVMTSLLGTIGAFHSPLMASAAIAFRQAFEGMTLSQPRIPLYSGAAGGLVSASQATSAQFWADQVSSPVRFDAVLAALLAEPQALVLEAGPGSVLTVLGRQACGSGSRTRFIPMLPDGPAGTAGELRSALAALAQCWVSGHRVTWPRHGEPDDLGRVPVPGYPYQRQRHWIDPPAARAPQAGAEPATLPAAASRDRQAGTAVDTALSTLAWSQCTDDGPPQELLTGHCLVIASEDEGENHVLVLALQRAGARPVIARPGSRYAAGASEFTVRLGHPGDYARVLAQMTRDGTPATLIVHATSLAEPPAPVPSAIDKHLRTTLGTLTALATHLAALPAASAPGLLIVTSRAADVSGAEQLSPVAASLVGFARSVALEAPTLGCRVLDMASPDQEILAQEICKWRTHAVVALRGSRRWQAGQVPFYPEPRQAHAAIRRRGVYLLTGGTGGIGMAIARGIAGTGMQPHLVLLSRTGRSAGTTDDKLRAGIAELEMCGAQVTVMPCDVTSARALHQALDTVATTIGPVNGVLHLAGLPGDGLVRTRSMEQMTSVLAPKVQGTVLLGQEFAQRPPLDFFACFSSRAAIDGLVGGADYAAANAFEDAYAITLRRAGIPALSINWPAWATVGLAATYGVRSWSTEVSPASCPIMDEHRLDGEAVLPGTGQLDLMLRGLRHITGSPLPVKLTDIVYHQMLASDRSRRLEVRLHPDGRVESWSWPSASLTAEPVLHAAARLAAAPERRLGAGLAALRAALTEPLAEEGASLFALGPRWDNIAGAWTRHGHDGSEVLLELRLPAGYAAEVSDYLAHPALLDSATTGFRRPEDGSHLPFCCSSFTFYEPVPAALFAYLRRSPDSAGIIRADLDLFDTNGRLLAQASGYTLRKVEAQLLRAASGPVAPQAADGIATADGVTLALSLLTARHPGQVLVEPGARPLAAARQRLAPGLATAPAGPAAEPGSPRPHPLSKPDEVEEKVRALWIDAIGDPEVTPDADFFAVGGNSLTAVSLIGGLREEFGMDLPISAIFDSPTIGSLAASIATQLGQLDEA